MTNGKILVGVLGLTLFFLVAGLFRSFFHFPEDKVKYNLLYVEGSYENLSLSFDLFSALAAHTAVTRKVVQQNRTRQCRKVL